MGTKPKNNKTPVQPQAPAQPPATVQATPDQASSATPPPVQPQAPEQSKALPTLESQLPQGWQIVQEGKVMLLRLPANSRDVFEAADAMLANAGMKRVDMRSYEQHGSLVLVINGVEQA